MNLPPKILGIIPARGGSKGIPRKNINTVGGKPLIAWTIEAAFESSVLSRLVLSSDDDEIIRVAKQYGCEVPFVRPPELATDTASSVDVVMHVLANLSDFDYLVLLQPTSPLRVAADIDNAVKLMMEKRAPSCVSVCAVEESPYWMFKLDNNLRVQRIVELPTNVQRRQDLPDVYRLNGAIYVVQVEWFLKNAVFVSNDTIGYVMPSERSLDIDTEEDMNLFRRCIEGRSNLR